MVKKEKQLRLIALISSSVIYNFSNIQTFSKKGFETQDIILLGICNLFLLLLYILCKIVSQKCVNKIIIGSFDVAFYYACFKTLFWSI